MIVVSSLVATLLALFASQTSALYYCSAPLRVPFPVNMTQKSLVFVAVLHRHGDRTPVYGSPVNDNVAWNCSLNNFATSRAPLDSDDIDAAALGRLLQHEFVAGQEALAGDCNFGQLTEKGDSQHYRLGSMLRAKYVSLLRFLPPTFNASLVWFRSTDYSRTFASLNANLRGLYPPTPQQGEVEVLKVHSRDQDRDYLLGGDGKGCPKFGSLLLALNKTGAFDKVLTDLNALLATLSTTVGVKSFNELMPLRDNALSRACHNLPQYAGLTDSLLEQLDGNLTINYYLKRSTKELQKYAIGPYFYHVLQLMNDITSKKPGAPIYAHWSAHDSTMTSINAVLGNVGEWPPYASHIEQELWQDQDGSYYVQVAIDGSVVRPFGAPFDMMPLDWYAAQLAPVLISEQDWRSQCGDPFHERVMKK